MKHLLAILALTLSGITGFAYERLQGPTELTYWDKAQTYDGYTFFGAQGTTYLLDMEGRVMHTWPVGIHPRLLDNGHVLDAATGDITGFTGLQEVDWNGSNVWAYTESRTGYYPHGDFLRIYNPKLGTNTTLYIANKAITSNQCLAAGCNPANSSYGNVTVDAIVEVNAAGTVIWEWCFFDHGCQNVDSGKTNYVTSISNTPGRINLNLPGRPLTNDWLHCVSLDYNQALDQIVVAAEGGEFYVIDHGNTFLAGNPTGSITLAAGTNGNFLYRFGDPARYNAGNPPSIELNWAKSTTGNKQIGGVGQVTWIPTNVPGAGHFLAFNSGQDLFESTPQSYLFEISGYLNSSTIDTGAYVNPPSAGYNAWPAPGHDTDKEKKNISRQVVSIFMSMANQAFFSHLGGSAQRLPNSNTLVCAASEGHIFEITPSSNVVWEYVNPVATNGVVTYKRDGWPLSNPVYRAARYSSTYPAFTGRILAGTNTITGGSPAYISAPTIRGVTNSPAMPSSNDVVSVTATITNSLNVATAKLFYVVSATTNSVVMNHTGALYSASIPAQAAGTPVQYFIRAADDFDNAAAYPTGAPTNMMAYTVYQSVVASGAALSRRVSGLQFTEGPAADAAGNIFFSDVTADTIYKWSLANALSVFRTNSGGANGLEFDSSGNLFACEGDNGRLVAITPQTNVVALTGTYGGLRYNEPNDLWIDPAGGVYFTDPVYFGHSVVQGGEDVYYLAPDRSSVIRVVTDMVRPNGLVGTSDGTTLYIADWGAGTVYRYGINGDGTLTNKTAFASVQCDGMTMDAEGDIYLTEDDVLVYNSAGQQVEQISIEPRPTNLAFGGSDRRTLFITTDDGSLYSLQMRVQGMALNGASNQAPVIADIAQSPVMPTSLDSVTISARVTDDIGVASATLTYSIGTGSPVTNTVFTETMATNTLKPWTGTGCDNPWSVTFSNGNPFQQLTNLNCGAGNPCAMQFSKGTSNLTDSMITTTNGIDARGSSGTIWFCTQTRIVSSNAGWALQLNPGTGFTTRLSGLTAADQANWQTNSYSLQAGDMVSNLAIRFQFSEGNTNNRVFLDQISIMVASAGSTSSNVGMTVSGVDEYSAQIPAQIPDTAVSYLITAVDGLGLVSTAGVGGAYSYVVADAADIPIAGFSAAPANGGAPLAVTFTDISSGGITNRFWDFGDGSTTNAATTNLSHTYSFPGTNTVQLIVTGPLGSSTNVQAGLIIATSVDTIGDGVPDWWRAQYFTGDGQATNENSCATCDPDHDGMNNLEEECADTDPTDDASRLEILQVSATSHGVELTWMGGSNAWQYLETSPTLADNQWTVIRTNRPPTATTKTVLLTGDEIASNTFYRINAWR